LILRETYLVFFKEQGERGGRREGPKALVPPFTRVLETDPSKIALVIYKSTVISIPSSK
jgi:hypothetical protein